MLHENLDLIEELRDKESMQLAAYQKRVSNYYNMRVFHRPLQKGNLMLRKAVVTNAFREEEKFRSSWEGPYRIQKMLGPNTCILQMLQRETLDKTWSTMHLKNYFHVFPLIVIITFDALPCMK